MSFSSSLSSKDDRYYFGPSRLIKKSIHCKSIDGNFDFSIIPSNSSQPIQISSVLFNSPSYFQGMRPLDQIISVNGIPFQNINSTQALQILNSMTDLDIIIETIRINGIDSTFYDWYDPIAQRATSPPPSTYLSNDAQLPYFQRTVVVKVEKGKRLGLVIRGGSEYGLGIFISGVDKGSLSDQSGLRIGDQILSVNGLDFRHITHADAVQLLRNTNNLLFHLREMNKLPKPKNVLNINESENVSSTNRLMNSKKRNYLHLIVDQDEKMKLKTYLRDYLQEQMNIDQLSIYFLNILNKQYQQDRNDIIQSIRKFVRPNDLDRFDISILKDDLNSLKFCHQRLIEESFCRSTSPNHSPKINSLSKSVENFSKSNEQILARPQSLLINKEEKFSPPIQRKFSIENNLNSLRKSQSLINVDQNNRRFTNNNLNDQQTNIIEHFLKDYSTAYPITIHKVRPTLGIAIEGGFQDRIPLPRVVYIQPAGSAYVSSGLRVGHVLVGLNGYSLKGLSHRQSALCLATAFKDKNNSQMNLLVVEPLNDEQDLN